MIPFYENKQGELLISKERRLNFPLHMHRSFEMVYVLEGSLLARIGRGQKLLGAGELCMVFPNQLHGYETLPGELNEAYVALFDSKILGGLYGLIQGKLASNPFVPGERIDQRTRANLLELASLAATGDDAVAQALVHLIFARMLPELALGDAPKEARADTLQRAVDYLSKHYAQCVSLEETARAISVSPYTLSKVIARAMGMGFCQYVNYMRVDLARHLLKTTDQSVTDVAMRCGFETVRTFNRRFKEVTGVAPRTYRQA